MDKIEEGKDDMDLDLNKHGFVQTLLSGRYTREAWSRRSQPDKGRSVPSLQVVTAGDGAVLLIASS